MVKSNVSPQTEIRCQTGLRGIAALVVALGHLPLEMFIPWFSSCRTFLFGVQAVDFFFLLSGFILAHTYLDSECHLSGSWSAFFKARFARIYPLHFAMTAIIGLLALFMVSRGMAEAKNYQLWHIPSQLFLVHSFPYIGVPWPWNYPSWSISVEAFCYVVVFPSLVLLLKRCREHPFMLWVTILALQLVNLIHLLCNHPDGEGATCGWTALVRGICGFGVGVFVQQLCLSLPPVVRQRLIQRADWLVILAGITWFLLVEGGFSKWWILPAFPILLIAFSEDSTSFSHKLAASRVVHYIGLLSYSIYMIHALFSKILGTVMRNSNSTWSDHPLLGAMTAAMIILALIGSSAFSYHCFEVPLRKFLRRILA